ncbi:MAG: hypothetical protein ACYCTD_04920 [bacterium]
MSAILGIIFLAAIVYGIYRIGSRSAEDAKAIGKYDVEDMQRQYYQEHKDENTITGWVGGNRVSLDIWTKNQEHRKEDEKEEIVGGWRGGAWDGSLWDGGHWDGGHWDGGHWDGRL